jgi:hypothetical protein
MKFMLFTQESLSNLGFYEIHGLPFSGKKGQSSNFK